MFHILGFLFIIVIAILLIGLSIIGTVIRSIFGLGGHRSSATQNRGGNYQSGGYSFNDRQQDAGPSQKEAKPEEKEEEQSKRKKLFSKDEGEYVDFEEIKE